MNSTDQNAATALTDLRKVRLSLQRQEQVYIQKLYCEVLQQIVDLMQSNQLSIEDVDSALHARAFKFKKAKKMPKPTVSAAAGVLPVSTADSVRSNVIGNKT